jgi:hypothetical protein
MDEQTPYQQLGVDENSSFDEIQNARQRLVDEHISDRQKTEAIEAAYDAILMDRLRLRQQGKIKVPDRIRFPERKDPDPVLEKSSSQPSPTSNWLQQWLDQPEPSQLLWPSLTFVGLAVLSWGAPAISIPLGIGASLYFLTRKEGKFGRSLLLTVLGLVLGILIGSQIANLLIGSLTSLGVAGDTVAAWVTLVVFWLIDSFLR